MLLTIVEANRLIAQGRALHVSGDARALQQLDRGNWLGGTSPYFLTSDGGCVDRERVFVTQLPDEAQDISIEFVGPDRLAHVPGGAPAHGFSLIVVPAESAAHREYAVRAHDLPGIFETPIIGWVAGVHLDELGRQRAQAINGRTGETATDRIAVLRAKLPETIGAQVGIINLFAQGSGDRLRFPATDFTADDCLINGERRSFYDYARQQKLDLRLPLVADLSGEMINVSFQSLDDDRRCVHFYAPVMAGVEYRQAAPLADYHAALLEHVAERPVVPAFACNCILNYLYADLAGDKGLSITGPVTFGEIAYVLLNQTLVYLELVR